MEFKPVYLYVKKHNITGLLYFGKTIKSNPNNYIGSGHLWRRHLNAHGKNISTILFEQFDNKEDLVEFANFFSKEFDIVNSNKWANLVHETGLDGWTKTIGMTGKTHSSETKLKMSIAQSGENNPSFGKTGEKSPWFGRKHSADSLLKMSIALSGENNPNLGLKRSAETKRKMSIASLGKKKQQIVCPHCGRIGSIGNMKRWHFDNCKFKGII